MKFTAQNFAFEIDCKTTLHSINNSLGCSFNFPSILSTNHQLFRPVRIGFEQCALLRYSWLWRVWHWLWAKWALTSLRPLKGWQLLQTSGQLFGAYCPNNYPPCADDTACWCISNMDMSGYGNDRAPCYPYCGCDTGYQGYCYWFY